MLEYQLFDRFPSRLPHVVLASYSANDAQNADPAHHWRTAQQDFVERVHRVRPCDDDLPLLVLADDLYGDMSLNAIEQTGSVYKTSSWYNLMSIAYSNVGRHAHVAYHRNGTRLYPLFGSDYKVHLGIGFHVAMAWTVLFNIVDALYEACVGDAVMPLLPATPSTGAGTGRRTRCGRNGRPTCWRRTECATKATATAAAPTRFRGTSRLAGIRRACARTSGSRDRILRSCIPASSPRPWPLYWWKRRGGAPRADFRLVSGTTFKIMGIAFCRI
jgi:hypothetical protein